MISKLFITLFFYLFFYNNLYGQQLISGKAEVIDGDTIHIGINKIRLHGIDSPEQKQECTINKKKWSCGKEATLYLSNLVMNKIINCKVNKIDKYNRYVSVCFIDKININKTMVNSGWAIAYRYYSMDYIEDEKIAKNNKKGIWQGKFEEPYVYRKNNK